MKILDKMWFTSGIGTIGLVLVENDIGEKRVYICPVGGCDEESDAEYVANWGCRVPVDIVINFLSKVKED